MKNSDQKNVDLKGWQQGDNPSRGDLRPEKTLRPNAADGHDRVTGKGEADSQKDDLLQSDTGNDDADALSGDQPDDPATGEPRMREVERKREGDSEESAD